MASRALARAAKPRRYFFGAAAFFFAGFAPAAALSRPAVRFFARRALSFRCLVRRRIFIDRRLSRLPMRRLITVPERTVKAKASEVVTNPCAC